MNRTTKILVIAAAVILVIVGSAFVFVKSTSGLGNPISVVTSYSMQHDNERSQIGIIDTGDAVFIQSASNTTLESYYESLKTGYKSFGDYGSVIIYNRGTDQNPVIHRAIVWIEYNGDGTWSAPSLADYSNWSCSKSTDCLRLSGYLEFEGITQSQKTVGINLDNFSKKQSGFLTMGDNPVSNKSLDQSGIIGYPISMDDIRAVACVELPWIGTLKLMMNEYAGNVVNHSMNSVYCLIMLFVSVFSLIWFSDIFFARKHYKKIMEEIENWEY